MKSKVVKNNKINFIILTTIHLEKEKTKILQFQSYWDGGEKKKKKDDFNLYFGFCRCKNSEYQNQKEEGEKKEEILLFWVLQTPREKKIITSSHYFLSQKLKKKWNFFIIPILLLVLQTLRIWAKIRKSVKSFLFKFNFGFCGARKISEINSGSVDL